MPSTYISLHYHLIFSTKNRQNLINDGWRDRLFAYLGGIITGLNGVPEGIGGVSDHVHLLVGLKATHCLSDVLRELKKRSSTWIHEQIGLSSFAWQEGYAAFTVGATSRDAVLNYIANQQEHHRTKSFREELIELLTRANISFDLKFLD
jgi:putative transposase